MSASFQIVFEVDQELIIAIFSLLFHVSETSKSFHPVRAPDGFSMCAVDRPAYSMSADDIIGIPPGIPNEVRCAYECTANTAISCMAFNVNNMHCQFYNNTTDHCFAASTTCVYVQVISTFMLYSIVKTAIIRAQCLCWHFTGLLDDA
jgi:hypothetical protein